MDLVRRRILDVAAEITSLVEQLPDFSARLTAVNIVKELIVGTQTHEGALRSPAPLTALEMERTDALIGDRDRR